MNPKIKLLLLGSAIWSLGEGMLGPLFAVYAGQVGGNILDISTAWAVYLIVTGILTIIIGKFSDRNFNKSHLMLVGCVLNIIFTFSYLLVDSSLKLLLVQAGLGIALSFYNPTWSALFSEYEDRKSDGYEWGMANGQYSLIMGVATILGGFIVTYYSFKALFVIMGSIQVISLLIHLKMLKKGW